MGKFEIYHNEEGKFFFRLKAGNSQVILASQGYATKAAAKNGVKSVQKNATKNEQFDRKDSKDGKFYFTMIARNKEIIGTSQMYNSKTGMEKGIASVVKNATDSTVVEV